MTHKELLQIKEPTIGQLEMIVDETRYNNEVSYLYDGFKWIVLRTIDYKEAWIELKSLLQNKEVQDLMDELEWKHNI